MFELCTSQIKMNWKMWKHSLVVSEVLASGHCFEVVVFGGLVVMMNFSSELYLTVTASTL